MTEIKETIYSTPRTYGSPTGRDHEISHLPNWHARMAEQILLAMLGGGKPTSAITACDIVQGLFAEFDRRGWLIEVVPAPDLDANYGKHKRQAGQGEGS